MTSCRKTLVWGIAAFVGLAVVIAWSRPARSTISFEVLDFVTGKPVPGATVEYYGTFNPIPPAVLEFFGIKSASCKTNVVRNGVAQVPNFRRQYITVNAPFYGEATITEPYWDGCEVPGMLKICHRVEFLLHDSPFEYVKRNSRFVVALEPQAGGDGRAGVRYRMNPSPGSKERAIRAIERIAEKNGGKSSEIGPARFVNGHWEFRAPESSGMTWRIEVSEEGAILGAYGGCG